jgi:putative Ca2+/H+ antiporter (TMEM165/GDT1 family)
MESSTGILITAFFMVFIMEMGDKTQLLVIAMASKYKPLKVFCGIMAAAILLNILAVLLGTAIGGIKIIQDCVRAGASVLFIFFGLLSLREEKEDKDKDCYVSQKVILAIAFAFFLAEFGDKTQLSAFSFAALYPENPLSVFLGATLGLLAADSLGLIAGTIIVKHIPKRTITYASAVIFIIFGITNGWTTMKDHFLLDEKICIPATAAMTLISVFAAFYILLSQKRRKRCN